MQARCACGDLTVTLPGPSSAVVACHCEDCQRRTGSPFGVGAYYSSDAVQVMHHRHVVIAQQAAWADAR